MPRISYLDDYKYESEKMKRFVFKLHIRNADKANEIFQASGGFSAWVKKKLAEDGYVAEERKCSE